MRILLVYHELSYRGGERLFAILAKGLLAKGNFVKMVVGKIGKNPRPFPEPVKIIGPGKLLSIIFQKQIFFLLFSMPFTLISILKSVKDVDVIYTGQSFLCLWPAILAAKITGKKIVLSVFELDEKKPDKINIFLIKKNIRLAVSINESLIPALKNVYKIDKVFYIPPGIDREEFVNVNKERIMKKYKLKGKKVIIMPGVLHPAKGQKIAIDTLAFVNKKFPEAILFIIGSGDKDYANSLEEYARTLNIRDSVIFTGYIDDEELKEYYAISDIVLQCGPIAGFTIAEALFMKKLAVYPTSGNPPLGPIEPLKVGVILKKNTGNEYARVIQDYYENSGRYKKEILKDMEKVKKTYSIERFTKETLRVFAIND